MEDITLSLINQVIPVTLREANLQYSESQNLLVMEGYTSYAGNTYYMGVRLSDRISISIDIGIGHSCIFLNGITIYTNLNREIIRIGGKSYYCTKYSEETIKKDACQILLKKLNDMAKLNNMDIDQNFLLNFINSLVEDTYKNQIETIKDIKLNSLLGNI